MRTISLTKGFVALIDDEDYERVACFEWQAKTQLNKHTAYAYRVFRRQDRKSGKTRQVGQAMHRFILGVAHSVDHIDGNGLNNQKSNLRLATPSQNTANSRKRAGGTSRFIGVNWDKGKKKWEAAICKNYKQTTLGFFKDEVDAATAYNFAALEVHGEFARMNTPEMGL